MRQPPPGKRSLCAVRRQSACPGVPDELRQPSNLGARHALAKWRQTVVPASLVVGARPPLLDLDDETLLDHARDGAIEGARAQAKLAVRSRLDVLNDRVAVSLTLGECQQDMQGRRRERQEIVGSRFRAHVGTIARMAIIRKPSPGLLPKRDHRFDAYGAARGDEAREERDDEQEERRHHEHLRIGWRDAEQ